MIRRNDSNILDPPNIYARAQCFDGYVEIPLTSFSMTRSNLGILVVLMDVLIVISFVLAFQFLGYYERLENKEYNEHNLLTEDFTVSIKNLPKYKDYKSLLELKARLWDHIESNVLMEQDLIVNIHFARADVKKLKILIKIKNLKTKLKR